MFKTLFYVSISISVVLLVFYWYAGYSTKSGFATDENNNNIPDSWEKYAILFRLKNIILLIIGFMMGYFFSLTTI